MDAVRDEDVRAELARILCSPDFEVSERNRRFLGHVVEETLAGRADRIKAYSIAISVFGRRDDFDPLQDSIVRIEAARLRRGLEHYYLKQGEPAGLRIAVPKGTYVPTFRFEEKDTAEPAPFPGEPAPAVLHDLEPRLIVEDFEQVGQFDHYPGLGRLLTRNVISALTKFPEILVYGIDAADGAAMRNGRAGTPVADYILLGTITITGEALQVEVLMQKAEDGRFVWAQTIERRLGSEPDPARMVGACGEIAGHLARTIALRDGIMDGLARGSSGDAARHFAGCRKLLDFHDYWRSLNPALFEPLRLGFKATIASDPGFAAGHACLSMLYSNAARYGYDLGAACDAPLDRALDLARRAIQLAPSSSRAHHARAVAEWFLGMPDQSIATLQTARSLNPNDPELLPELGFRSAMRMEWESAVPMINEAYRQNPLLTGQYRMGLFLYHLAERRFAEALQEIAAINAPHIAHVHLGAAAALSGLGRLDEARGRLAAAERLGPRLRLGLNQDLAFRQVHASLAGVIETHVQRLSSA